MKEKRQAQLQANKEIGLRRWDEGKMPCTLELPELPWELVKTMKNDILCGRNCLRKEVMVTKEVQVGSESTGWGKGTTWSRGSVTGGRMSIELRGTLSWENLTAQRFLHLPAGYIHERYPRSSQALMQTPQVPLQLLTLLLGLSHGEKGQLTSFLTSHCLQASRQMVSLPVHLSTMKRKILI